MDMDTRLCLTRRTSQDLLASPGNSGRCHAAAGMGGEFGGEWVRVYVWLSPFLSTWNYHNIDSQLYSKTK